MKKLLFIVSCVLMTCVGFQSCKSDHQKQVRTDVDRVLSNNYPTLSYSIDDEVVTIDGMVDSEQEKISAENLVRSVHNVKSVVNNVTVRQAVTSPSAVNRDETLRSTIMSRLNNAGYRDVSVDVIDGEVTLTGDIDRNDLSRVMQIANEANPSQVTNRLTLR